jgi:hypothetical protein
MFDFLSMSKLVPSFWNYYNTFSSLVIIKIIFGNIILFTYLCEIPNLEGSKGLSHNVSLLDPL